MSDEPQWETTLLDAFALVHGDRGDTYGPPWEDYDRVTDVFNALTGHDLSRDDGLLFMVCMKLSRVAHGLEEGFPAELLRDSVTDASGYLDCLWGSLTAPEPDDTDDLDEDDE